MPQLRAVKGAFTIAADTTTAPSTIAPAAARGAAITLPQQHCALSVSVTDALFTSFEPQLKPQREGVCKLQREVKRQLQGEMEERRQLQGEREERRQLQGERLDRQPQSACAPKKPPLTRTSESAIPKINFLLIFISLKF